jgi:FlaA1/EpsC-like NDP-sugar epimerase
VATRNRIHPLLLRYRSPLVALSNLSVIGVAYVGAFLLRFDLAIPKTVKTTFLQSLPIALVVQYLSFWAFKLTRGWWRYVGVADFVNAIKSALVGTSTLAVIVMFTDRHHFPRSVFILYPMLVVGLSIGLRLVVRQWRQVPGESDGPRKRVLVVGAGDTGEALLREARQSPKMSYQIIAFLDDDARKHGMYINGVPVYGAVEKVVEAVERLRIDEIVVATPSASGNEMRQIIAHCRSAKVPFKALPATWEVLRGHASLTAARDVDINDLLRRPRVELDVQGIGHFLHEKTILVTGAAGSIGSEICQQVLHFEPATLICLDHDENALFYLERAMRGTETPTRVLYVLADITDLARMESIFKQHRPQVVFHAAAHKHVPMIEQNPSEGVRNNVFGTETVATLAGKFQSEAFVLVSTDKAVNPTSMMGASKRIAECLIQTLPYDTRYTAVRFGNVLGSQGSVVPLLKEQIAKGGPVTVTHPDMRRYFMTIPEAVELVLQASAMGREDEIFLLDMGDPVHIVDLARDLITLSGLRPGVDVEIVFTGVRPGEKLYEELYLEGETADRTAHPKILVARRSQLDAAAFSTLLDALRAAAQRGDDTKVRQLVPDLVPEYQGARLPANIVPISAAHQSK